MVAASDTMAAAGHVTPTNPDPHPAGSLGNLITQRAATKSLIRLFDLSTHDGTAFVNTLFDDARTVVRPQKNSAAGAVVRLKVTALLDAMGVEERAAFGINWSAVAELMGGRFDKRGGENTIVLEPLERDLPLSATSLCALVREGLEAEDEGHGAGEEEETSGGGEASTSAAAAAGANVGRKRVHPGWKSGRPFPKRKEAREEIERKRRAPRVEGNLLDSVMIKSE